MDKRKEYRIVRTVKEVFHIEAASREEAIKNLAIIGCIASEITVVKETVRQINKNF